MTLKDGKGVLRRHAQILHPDFKLVLDEKSHNRVRDLEEFGRNVTGIKDLKKYVKIFNKISIKDELNLSAKVCKEEGRHPDKIVIYNKNNEELERIRTIPIPSDNRDLCEGTVQGGILPNFEEVLFERLLGNRYEIFYEKKMQEKMNLIYKIDGEKVGIYIDTCHLLEMVNERKTENIFKDVFGLLTKNNLNTIILMKNVMEEFENNLKTIKEQEKRQKIWKEWNELKYNNLNKNIWIEEIEITKEDRLRLSEKMKKDSPKNNSRLGEGEAAIMLHIEEYHDIFNKIVVYSNDSDLTYLIEGMKDISIIKNIA
jgi:hypothetical protein